MRKETIHIAIIAIAALLVGASSAHAGKVPVFFSWGGEQIIKVADFPDTEEFKSIEGKYIDAGYRYKQITLFFVPLWNYGGQWCGYIGDSDHYLDISKADLANFANIKLPDTPSLPFWDSYGGKLLLLVILVVGGMAQQARGSTVVEASNPQSVPAD